MFDFLTLSVVIDDRIFCVHGGVYVLPSIISAQADVIPTGLSPSIHSIDQIKVVDRFRGEFLWFMIVMPLLSSRNSPRGSNGWSRVVRSRSRKRGFRNIASVHFIIMYFQNSLTVLYQSPAVPGIRLAQASYTNSSRWTTCRMFCARTNSAWRATRVYLTNTFQLFGPHQIIATVVGIQQAYWRLDRGRTCFSMYSKQRQKMSGMGPVIKLHSLPVGRYNCASIS